MGGHISQKLYEFTTGDREIDRYGWVYRLVIENVDRCDWYYRLVIENDDRYGSKKLLNIKADDCYGREKDWCLKTITQRPGNKRGIVHVF